MENSALLDQAVSRLASDFGITVPAGLMEGAETFDQVVAAISALAAAETAAAFGIDMEEMAPDRFDRNSAAMDGVAGADGSVVRPVVRDAGPLPVSFAQQRLWFLD
ncbi:hypothetical protein, partial [Kitasatospora sp. NPDC057198]|uniref:hypothetical protein n=1 Tax=Kitasatospora sp. NPDC057198 TaxID=3346046 RepID=UPI00363F4D21